MISLERETTLNLQAKLNYGFLYGTQEMANFILNQKITRLNFITMMAWKKLPILVKINLIITIFTLVISLIKPLKMLSSKLVLTCYPKIIALITESELESLIQANAMCLRVISSHGPKITGHLILIMLSAIKLKL